MGLKLGPAGDEEKSAFSISGVRSLQINVAFYAFLFLEIVGKIVKNLYLFFTHYLLLMM